MKKKEEKQLIVPQSNAKFWWSLIVALIIAAGVGYGLWYYNYVYIQKVVNPLPTARFNQPIGQSPGTVQGEFCGASTNGDCQENSDCQISGCSNQICQSQAEEPQTTTCEFRDCYDAQKYKAQCACQNQQCQWTE